jgi:hypothetical protein
MSTNLFYSQKLNAQIDTIQENDLKELKTMVDLGSQFYVQAHMYEYHNFYKENEKKKLNDYNIDRIQDIFMLM